MSISLVTYNLLDDSMAISKFFDLSDEHLILQHRMPLILRRLSEFINQGGILCLQEVGLKLAEAGLHQLLAENGYYSLNSHYSTPERDFHGVCLAFPAALYFLIKYGEVTIGDSIVLQDAEHAQVKNQITVFEEAKKRDCRLLWAILEHKSEQRKIFICTYHMPCCSSD